MKKHFLVSLFGICCLAYFPFAVAQEAAASDTALSEQEYEIISLERLDALLAPIALYPDALLAQVLMASTYPMDVIEAARWRAMNPDVEGERLQNVLEAMKWDASVKALVMTPGVLQQMNDEPRWMQELGDAVLADQARVMERVQYLRQQAKATNGLVSNDKHVVEVKREEDTEQTYIAIAPASQEVVYVPYYDPVVVYGDWWWPSRPVYWRPPYGAGFTSGYYWGNGYRTSVALWGGFSWRNGLITISVPLYTQYYRTQPMVVGPYSAWWRPAPMYAPPYYYHGGVRVVRPPRPWYRPSPPYYGDHRQRPPSHVRPPHHDRPQVRPPQQDRPPQQGRPPQQDRPPQQGRPPQGSRPDDTYLRPPQGNRPTQVQPPQGSRPTENTRQLQGSSPSQGSRPAGNNSRQIQGSSSPQASKPTQTMRPQQQLQSSPASKPAQVVRPQQQIQSSQGSKPAQVVRSTNNGSGAQRSSTTLGQASSKPAAQSSKPNATLTRSASGGQKQGTAMLLRHD